MDSMNWYLVIVRACQEDKQLGRTQEAGQAHPEGRRLRQEGATLRELTALCETKCCCMLCQTYTRQWRAKENSEGARTNKTDMFINIPLTAVCMVEQLRERYMTTAPGSLVRKF